MEVNVIVTVEVVYHNDPRSKNIEQQLIKYYGLKCQQNKFVCRVKDIVSQK